MAKRISLALFLASVFAATVHGQDAEVERQAGFELPALVRADTPSDESLGARAEGQLRIDESGCLRHGDRIVIWHHDTMLERTEDARIRLTDGYSGTVVYVGETFAMGGGYAGDRIPPRYAGQVPSECDGPFFVGGPVELPETRANFVPDPRYAVPANLPENYVPDSSTDQHMDTGPIAERIRREYASRLAGMYFEDGLFPRVVVRLTGEEPVDAELHATGGRYVAVEFETGANHTLGELLAAIERHTVITSVLPSSHARYVDERTGELVVAVDPGDETGLRKQGELAEALGVPVKVVEEERAVIGPARRGSD